MPTTTFDPNYPNNPVVQPVGVEALGRQYDLLYSNVYTAQAANFNDATVVDTSKYRNAHVTILITAITGTTPTLQIDLREQLPDLSFDDYSNNGTHNAPGAVRYDVGPGMGVNRVCPANINLAYVIAGTTPSVTFKVWIWGEK